ncbi:hypothetical protein FIU87_11885 [Bacillus sp. THAF10]|nr:hypothetical protein FIU87_11885 [Bacillus sp. THAF10]
MNVEHDSTSNLVSKNTICNEKEWESFQTSVYRFQGEHCFIREKEYSLDHKHGKYQLKDLIPIMKLWQNADVEHPLSGKGHHSSDLFFFDTETTGLSGGVGTTIFLLGYARVFSDKVVIRQHLLPGPGNEVALYQSFLENVNYKTLVTYNGKAFDWPQVKTRHTLVREHVPKLPAFGHFDLLHASRRLWKSKMEAVRLVNVEKEILEIERQDDIPGFLAPMIYVDFVKTQEMQGIKGVMKHNEWDVLTLITLYIHLSKLLLLDGNERSELEDFEIGRWYDTLGEKEAAASIYENIVESSWKAAMKLGYLKKKERRFCEAELLFKQALADPLNDSKEEACEELSKIYEHQKKSYDTALLYAEKALKNYNEKANQPKQKKEKKLADFIKRITRIQKKLDI